MNDLERYKAVCDGLWWRVKIGDGEQLVGRFLTETGAQRFAAHLHRAYCDGAWSRTPVEEAAAEIAWRDGYADEIREILGATLEPAEALFRVRNVVRLWDKRRDDLTGWMLCDGAAVSRSTYAALFAILGVGEGEIA